MTFNFKLNDRAEKKMGDVDERRDLEDGESGLCLDCEVNSGLVEHAGIGTLVSWWTPKTNMAMWMVTF